MLWPHTPLRAVDLRVVGFRIMEFREFSGGLVVTTGHLHCWGPGSCAGCENLNLASRACGMAGVKKKKESWNLKTVECLCVLILLLSDVNLHAAVSETWRVM